MTGNADALLQTALAAHRAGQLEAAERGYRAVLERVPGEPMALYLLGLVCFHRGDTQAAIAHLRVSLQRAPRQARAWKDLGGMLMASGQLEQARDAYRQAVQHAPGGENWYNLGVCVSKLGQTTEAIAHLRQAVTAEPGFTKSYEPLALLLYRSGDLKAAAQVYRQWLIQEPQHPTARYMAQAADAAGRAADTAQQRTPAGTPERTPARRPARTPDRTPDRAPDDYIRAHFDEAAASFDANLEQLGYRAPALLAATLARLSSGPVAALLDAGCGTGLCGPLVRAQCQSLTGVDLSGAMLAHAASRGCYDELVEAELTAFMTGRPGSFNAILCADTLVYFGSLTQPLAAAHTALQAGGLLLFTVEESSSRQPRLEIHGRYTHSEAYVRDALQRARFTVSGISRETLRKEREQPVAGLVVSARRA